MLQIGDLLRVIDAFKRASELEDVTVSHRLFSDSKKLAALRSGADITVTRFNAAMSWLSTNWPADASWPADVQRPVRAALFDDAVAEGIAAQSAADLPAEAAE